jgi:hypothetical protein
MLGVVEGPDGSPRARRSSSRGPERGANGPQAGFFESFTFFQIGRKPWAFVGPVALTRVYVF